MATRERTAADQYLEMPYEISLVRRDDEHGAAWAAQVEELPGCEARGRTEEEALAEVRGAMAAWIADALASGKQIPAPRAAATHSGRLLVRMPPTLHADLARLADREKVSLNTLIVGVLSGAISWRQTGELPAPPATTNGAAPQAASATPTAARRERLLSVALTANLVVVIVAGLLAIGLLIALLVT